MSIDWLGYDTGDGYSANLDQLVVKPANASGG
jgi:hypothetical protein